MGNLADISRSDAYEDVQGIITATLTPSKSPTSLPLTPTHLILAILPPSLLLPLIPVYLIPYLLLPIGWAPPLAFHPNLAPFLSSLPALPVVRRAQAMITRLMLTDSLPDDLGRAFIAEVEVWENERLDPAVSTAKAVSGNVLPTGSWSQRFLRAGERMPWVKIRGEGSVWGFEDNEAESGGAEKAGPELKQGWSWIPGEEWRVDVSGLWSDVGVDAGKFNLYRCQHNADGVDGWVYSDDSWQNLAVTSLPGAELDSPVPAMRRVTRRRKWWKRVYIAQEG